MNEPRRIFMTGIGGIGMSALAQLLKHRGNEVSGSDRDHSPVVALLAEKGIAVAIGHDGCNIPAGCELLIYSDAVPEDNVERMRAKEMSLPQLSYFDTLGEISKGVRTIAVAGTHGKTTTTGMLAKILQRAGKEPTAIVGSIVRDFGSNFLAGSPGLFVVEACEYRDHLLKLSPEILVITNIELDHTDYFPDLAALKETFRKAAECAKVVVTDPSNPVIADVIQSVPARVIDFTKTEVPELGLIGEFNRNNARAAKAAALAAYSDMSLGAVDDALANFQGSWRRFEYKGETPSGAMVFDDYAHHPTAIEKTIEAAREKFPDKKIIVAFHPHLFSRTRSFMKEFAAALAMADRAIVAPIYAAREMPDPSVTHHALAERAGDTVIALDSFEAIRHDLLKVDSRSLIITMGAGDIYKVAEQIAD